MRWDRHTCHGLVFMLTSKFQKCLSQKYDKESEEIFGCSAGSESQRKPMISRKHIDDFSFPRSNLAIAPFFSLLVPLSDTLNFDEFGANAICL